MNNLIIKLIITLVLFSTILFVDSHSIDKRSSPTEGVIIGPNTPVYYLTYPHDDFLKVTRDVNKFEASPSYNYYRNPENEFQDIFFLNILVVLDWNSGIENRAEEDILNQVLTDWNKVDKYFQQLDNPKIKLTIAGVVIPKKADIWEPPMFRDVSFQNYWYRVPSFLENMMKWFNDNNDKFESLNYDFFIYMSQWKMALQNEANEILEFPGYAIYKIGCNDANDTDQFQESLGGTAFSSTDFGFNAAITIASMLGVETDYELGCDTGYIMDDFVHDVTNLTWSKCSKQVFESMLNNSNYTCLQQIPDNQNEDDYL